MSKTYSAHPVSPPKPIEPNQPKEIKKSTAAQTYQETYWASTKPAHEPAKKSGVIRTPSHVRRARYLQQKDLSSTSESNIYMCKRCRNEVIVETPKWFYCDGCHNHVHIDDTYKI